MTEKIVKAGLIGHGISQSLTPAMHEAEGAAQGLSYRYDSLDVATYPYADMTLEAILDMAEAQGYSGLNVTHPFKVEVVRLLDGLSDCAQEIGAVNTVVIQNGKRIGHNTDYIGFKTALEQNLQDAARRKVLLLGAGGAGIAVALALIDAGVEHLLVYDRQPSQAQALAARMRQNRPDTGITSLQDLDGLDFDTLDGVVNSTPMGMAQHPGTAVDPNLISTRSWVADIVYFPIETRLLHQAAERGCRVMNGTGMAVYQAAAAFELITGRAVDPARFTTVATRLIAEKRDEQKRTAS